MDKIEIYFEYTQSEYVKAARKYLLASKTIRRYDLALAALSLMFAVFYTIYSSFSTVSIFFVVALTVVTALGYFLYYHAPVLRFTRTEKYHQPYRLTFTPERILWQTPSIDTQMKWEIFAELWQDDEFYFLVHGGAVYTLVPKRAFGSEADAEAFERMAAEKVKKIKKV